MASKLVVSVKVTSTSIYWGLDSSHESCCVCYEFGLCAEPGLRAEVSEGCANKDVDSAEDLVRIAEVCGPCAEPGGGGRRMGGSPCRGCGLSEGPRTARPSEWPVRCSRCCTRQRVGRRPGRGRGVVARPW